MRQIEQNVNKSDAKNMFWKTTALINVIMGMSPEAEVRFIWTVFHASFGFKST